MNNTREQIALNNATPGSILDVEFLQEFNLSQAAFARACGIPRSTINEIIRGKRAISVEHAIAFSACFGTTPEFWLNLQTMYDLQTTEAKRGKQIRSRVTSLHAA